MAKKHYDTYVKRLSGGSVYLDKIARFKYDLEEDGLVEIIEKPNHIEIRKIKEEKQKTK